MITSLYGFVIIPPWCRRVLPCGRNAIQVDIILRRDKHRLLPAKTISFCSRSCFKMRRGAGISAISRQSASTASYATLSTALSANQVSDLRAQLETFRSVLVEFSTRHRDDIRKDPALRHQFQKMCAGLGIDPLASSSAARPRTRLVGSSSAPAGAAAKGKAAIGGLWQDLFATISDWEYELALQIVDICVSTRARNGGIIAMDELIRRVKRLRRGLTAGGNRADQQVAEDVDDFGDITPEDVERAIKALAPLEAGYELVQLDRSASTSSSSTSSFGKTYVRSVASELGIDQAILLGLASDPASASRGRLDERLVARKLGWTAERTRSALEVMVKRDGLGWVDEQAEEDDSVMAERDIIVGAGWTVWVPSAIEWEDA